MTANDTATRIHRTATDALVEEFATAADVTFDRAADLLATLDADDIGHLAQATADLGFRNLAAGHTDPFTAASRRVGREAGRAFAAAQARRGVVA